MSDAPATAAVFTDGPLNSCSIAAVPMDTRIIYVTFDASNRDNIRWAVWTASQQPGTVPALVVDPGEAVYVYKVAQRLNPFVNIQDGSEKKKALLFQFWSEGASVKDTLKEEPDGEEG